jgi:hypothetical protein
LPEFLKLKGTLGMPEAKPDWKVIAQLALQSGGSFMGNPGGAAVTNGQSGTNAVQAPNDPAAELIRGLGGLLGGSKKKATNQPATQPKP